MDIEKMKVLLDGNENNRPTLSIQSVKPTSRDEQIDRFKHLFFTVSIGVEPELVTEYKRTMKKPKKINIKKFKFFRDNK